MLWWFPTWWVNSRPIASASSLSKSANPSRCDLWSGKNAHTNTNENFTQSSKHFQVFGLDLPGLLHIGLSLHVGTVTSFIQFQHFSTPLHLELLEAETAETAETAGAQREWGKWSKPHCRCRLRGFECPWVRGSVLVLPWVICTHNTWALRNSKSSFEALKDKLPSYPTQYHRLWPSRRRGLEDCLGFLTRQRF